MRIELTYQNTSLTLDALVNSFSMTEVFHNNLKQADNSATFTAVFTIELANFLKAHVNDDVRCVITEDEVTVFTGFLRKNFTFTKTQINQPIAVEVVSPSYFLDKTVTKPKGFIGQKLSKVVGDLLTDAGFTSVGDLSALSVTPQVIFIKEGLNYKNVITQLLYEYGYIFDFDRNGMFQVYELFNQPNKAGITKHFTGANCLNQIQIQAKNQSADHVRATYSEVTRHQNALIFRDSTNAQGQNSCTQPVPAGEYFAGEQYNYLDTDSEFGEVLYINSIRADVKTDSGFITYQASKLDLGNNNKDLGNQICFSAYNSAGKETHNLTRIDFYGDVYTKSDVIENKDEGDKGTSDVKLEYVYDSVNAKKFCENYSDWLRYATNTITLQSKVNWKIGDFVTVEDYGIGKYYGRIVRKVTTISGTFAYTVETIADYVPAVAETKKNQGANLLGAIQGVRENAFAYTDDKIAQVVLEASPQFGVVYSATTVRKTGENTYNPEIITAMGRKVTGDETAEPYSGTFHIYLNGRSEEYGVPVHGSELTLSLSNIAANVGDINRIDIVFKTASDTILIDRQDVTVLSTSDTYQITLDNAYNAFLCDSDGKVKRQSIVTKPVVYLGFSEVPYGAEGWEYLGVPEKEGFEFSVDYTTGELTITTIDGANIEDVGNIPISIYIHSSKDEPINIGYVGTDGVEYFIGYVGEEGQEFSVGYVVPAESGTFICYFGFSKLTELGLLLTTETEQSSPNYGEYVLDGKKLKVGSVEAESINVDSLMAESLTVGNEIKSSGFESKTKGFRFSADGSAEVKDLNAQGGTFSRITAENANLKNTLLSMSQSIQMGFSNTSIPTKPEQLAYFEAVRKKIHDAYGDISAEVNGYLKWELEVRNKQTQKTTTFRGFPSSALRIKCDANRLDIFTELGITWRDDADFKDNLKLITFSVLYSKTNSMWAVNITPNWSISIPQDYSTYQIIDEYRFDILFKF